VALGNTPRGGPASIATPRCAQAAIKKHLDYQSAKGMSDQDRLLRQIPNLLLEVIDQPLDGYLCKARIGSRRNSSTGLSRYGHGGMTTRSPLASKKSRKLVQQSVVTHAPWTNMMAFDINSPHTKGLMRRTVCRSHF
jgi:hypothetical protein